MSKLDKIRQVLSCSIDADGRQTGKEKLAAVMVIIHGPEPTVIMTERPKTMHRHAGEISFPGGLWQQNDVDLLETALREAGEEMGVTIPRSRIIGQLRTVNTVNSAFGIYPFVAVEEKTPPIKPNSEVESVLSIPLIPLLKTLEDDRDPAHRSIMEIYTFRFQDHLIWGASARILRQIHAALYSNGLL